MKTMISIGMLTALVLALAGMATATTKGPLPPDPGTIDCSIGDNKNSCVECGGSGIACCFDDSCTVINKPTKVFVPAPTPPRVPVAPPPRWEFL